MLTDIGKETASSLDYGHCPVGPTPRRLTSESSPCLKGVLIRAPGSVDPMPNTVCVWVGDCPRAGLQRRGSGRDAGSAWRGPLCPHRRPVPAVGGFDRRRSRRSLDGDVAMTQFYHSGGSGHGPPGPRGLQGVQGEVGPGVINWTGEWSGSQAYALNDAVAHNGSSYICIEAHSGSEPPSSQWAVLASKGEQATGCARRAGYPRNPGAR